MTVAELFRQEGRQEERQKARQEERQKGIQEGEQKGEQKSAKKIAFELLKMGIDLETISKATKLRICEIPQKEI